MSQRHYSQRGNRQAGAPRRVKGLLAIILSMAILAQITYPLVEGQALRVATFATIYFAAAAMVLHGYYAFGARYATTYFFITFVFSLLIEQLGVRTGWPFGNYTYGASLGFQIFSVPLVVPFAWMMMAHPVLVAGRRVSKSWIFLYGGIALMGWDLLLDPTMVAESRWSWTFTGAHVPFEPTIPLSNAAGWLFVGMGLITLLHLVLPQERRKEIADFSAVDIFLGWTLFSGVVSNLFFFHRPGVALIGGLVFGAALAPYAFSRWFGRP